jgi:uncharacterized protein (DUF1330 family)
MPAYVIAEFASPDARQPGVARLRREPRAGRFGERTLVDTGAGEVLAGDWNPQRLVVLEFPTLEQARSWWESRERTAPPQMLPVTRRIILVEGL